MICMFVFLFLHLGPTAVIFQIYQTSQIGSGSKIKCHFKPLKSLHYLEGLKLSSLILKAVDTSHHRPKHFVGEPSMQVDGHFQIPQIKKMLLFFVCFFLHVCFTYCPSAFSPFYPCPYLCCYFRSSLCYVLQWLPSSAPASLWFPLCASILSQKRSLACHIVSGWVFSAW